MNANSLLFSEWGSVCLNLGYHLACEGLKPVQFLKWGIVHLSDWWGNSLIHDPFDYFKWDFEEASMSVILLGHLQYTRIRKTVTFMM